MRLLLGRHRATLRERIDGTLLLGVYAMAPITIIGWLLALGVFYQGVAPLHGILAILAITAYASVGNMPVLYIVFGLPLDVLIIIAFYSWGMTWNFKSAAVRALKGEKVGV